MLYEVSSWIRIHVQISRWRSCWFLPLFKRSRERIMIDDRLNMSRAFLFFRKFPELFWCRLWYRLSPAAPVSPLLRAVLGARSTQEQHCFSLAQLTAWDLATYFNFFRSDRNVNNTRQALGWFRSSNNRHRTKKQLLWAFGHYQFFALLESWGTVGAIIFWNECIYNYRPLI